MKVQPTARRRVTEMDYVELIGIEIKLEDRGFVLFIRSRCAAIRDIEKSRSQLGY